MSNKVADVSSPSILSGARHFVVRPDSVPYQIWEGVMALLCFLSTLSITFQVSFKNDVLGFTALNYVCDVLYIIHILLKLNVAFIREGGLVTNKRRILRNYLSTEFIFDLISILPLEFIYQYGKLNRVFRFYTTTKFFGKHEDKLGFSTKSFRSFKYFLVAFTLIHTIACGWYVLACPNESDDEGLLLCYDDAWATVKGQNMANLTTVQRYVKCLYWAAITATTTGYGDIHAVNATEKWYSLASMLFGIGFFFGPVLGYMASTLTNADAKRSRYTHRIEVIKEHLNYKAVSKEITKKVTDYYDHLWYHHQGIVKNEMFSELPLTFQAEISLALNKHVLEKAPLFHDVSEDFTRMTSLVIKQITYLPKQIVFFKNDVRHTLFYIKKGSVEVLSDVDEKPVKVLKEGSFFGEVSLLLNIPRCATVRAATYCELLLLERTDLMKVLKHFPDVSEQLYAAIEERCMEATSRQPNTSIMNKRSSVMMSKASVRVAKSILFEDVNTDTQEKKLLCLDKLESLTFTANSDQLLHWKIFVAFMTTISAFAHTVVLCYGSNFGRPGYGGSSSLKLIFSILYIIDIIQYIDMFVDSRTKRSDDKDQDGSSLLRSYLKSPSFWFNMAFVFPLEIFSFALSGSYNRWMAATFLRSNRVFKIYKVFSLFGDLEGNIRFDIIKVRFLKLFLLICAATHTCACVWYFQACHGDFCSSSSWAIKAGITEHTGTFDVYVTTLYWAAATMTSTGYGDIHATTSRGEFIVLFVTITGLLLYGYCLSNIAATLTNKLSPKVEFMGRINAVLSFMLEQKLDPTLVDRVNRYLGLVWRINKGEAVPGSQLLMGDMPLRLQQDVSYEEMHEILAKVPIFQNTDTSFIRQLSAQLITYVFVPGDMIVYSGDVGREMYIMRRGLVEVLSKDRSYTVATLGPGGYFGEVGLIFGESRTADVRAKTYCEVAMLRKSNLDEVLVNFPLIERQLRSTSENKGVLEKMKVVAKEAGTIRKPNRIDLIERSRTIRSKSIFRRLSLMKEMSEEESIINEELNCEFTEPYKRLHPVLYVLSHLMLRTSVDPHGIWFRSWTVISIGFSLIYIFTLGLQVAFLQEEKFLWIINYSFDVFFLIDIYIKLHVSFYNAEGVLVTHPTATAKNYFKNYFITDFIAFVPLDLLVLSLGYKVAFGYSKLNRLFHIIRVVQYFNYLNEPISGNASLYRNIKFTAYMFLLTHLCACCFFILGCPYRGVASHAQINSSEVHTFQCTSQSWAVQNGRELGSEEFFNQYIVTMYWSAATTCSVGYGDIHAYLIEEMGISLLIMIVGVVFYGYIIASGAASLANADAQRARYQQKLDSINRFLREQAVSSKLAKRVKGFYEYLWNRNKGVDLENLFQGLPISLQADITLSLYKDIIESVPLFQGTELGFTKMLSLYIKPLLVPKGEYIVRKGDIGEEMFFIHKGIVEVVSEHEVPIIFDTMSPGRFFGEISTIFSCPRTASIRTQTNADVFVLTKKDLDVVLSHYPQIRKQIIETAEERQNMVKKRAAAAAEAKKKEDDRKKQENETKKNENENSVSTAGDNSENAANKPDAEVDIVATPTLTERLGEYFMKKKAAVTKSLQFVIDQDSPLRHITNICCLLTFMTFITTTYMATYQHHPVLLIVFNLFTEVVFYVEMFFKFHTVFSTFAGEEVTSLAEISRHYLHGEFKFDAVANFPIGLFCFVVSTNRLQLYSYLNLLHILRLKRLRDGFKNYLRKLNINVLLIRMMENLAQVMIVLQLLGCIWYFIACPANVCRKNSWVGRRDRAVNHVTTPEDNYIDSLYWALATMTSTGYGDIHATNNVEMVFASISMVIGKLVFGYVLGNVASTMANVEVLRVLFDERFSAVQAHMKEQKVPEELQKRVVSFFQYIWRRNRGCGNEALFNDLPPCLHAELCLELTGECMKRVPLLLDCELPFLRLLCTRTQLIQFHEHEYITRKGDIGDEMYFVKRGQVEVIDGNDVTVLQEGDFCGDAYLLGSRPYLCSTRAKTHADVFSLKYSDLEKAFQSYPEEEKRVRENATRFYQNL